MNSSDANGPQESQKILELESYVKQHTGNCWDSLNAPLMMDNSAATLPDVSSSGSVSMLESSFRTLSKRFFRLVNPSSPLRPSWAEGSIKTNHEKKRKIRHKATIFACPKFKHNCQNYSSSSTLRNCLMVAIISFNPLSVKGGLYGIRRTSQPCRVKRSVISSSRSIALSFL